MSRSKRRHQRRKPFSVPIGVSLFLTSALLVLIVAGSLAGLLLRSRTTGLEERANESLAGGLERIALQTEALTGRAERALASARDILLTLPADGWNHDTLRRGLVPLLAHVPELAAFRVSAGSDLNWLLYPDGDSWLTRRAEEGGSAWERWSMKDGSLLNTEPDEPMPPPDSWPTREAALRAYRERMDGNTGTPPSVAWAGARVLERTQRPGMSAGLAFDRQPDQPASIEMDVDWRDISLETSRVYDLRPEQLLVAAEDGGVLAPPRRVNTPPEGLLTVGELDHPLAHGLRRFRTDTYPPEGAFQDQRNGNRWWFRIRPIALGGGAGLYLAAGLTETHLLRQEIDLRNSLIGGTVLALVLAGIFAVLYSRMLNAPLREFQRRTRRIDFLTRSAALRPKSRLREADNLYAALDDLCEAVIQQLEAQDIPMVLHAQPVGKRSVRDAAEALAVPAAENLPVDAPADSPELAELYIPEAYIQALQATRRELRKARQRHESTQEAIAQAERSIATQQDQWRAARDTARAVGGEIRTASGNPREVCRALCEQVAKKLAIARCGVWVREKDGDTLECISRFDRLSNNEAPGARLGPQEHFVLFNALADLAYLSVADFRSDPRAASLAPLWTDAVTTEPMLIAPWSDGAGLAGWVLFEDASGPRQWSVAEETLALATAAHMARLFEPERPAPSAPSEPVEVEPDGDEYDEAPIYRHLLDSTRGIVLAVSDTGRILFANPAAALHYATDAADLVGQPLSELAASGYRDIDHECLKRVLAGEERIDSDTEHVTGEGKTIRLRLTWAPLEEETGDLVGAVILAAEHGEDRAHDTGYADSRYRLIAEGLAAGFFSVDPHGILEFVSPHGAQLYGMRPAELTGCSIAALSDEAQGERDLQALEALMQGRPCSGYHAVHRGPGGREFAVTIYANVVRDDDHNPVGAVGVVFAHDQP